MYFLLNLYLVSAILVHDVRVEVVDGTDNRPVAGATIMVEKRGARADRNGVAVLHGVSDTCIVTTRMAGFEDHVDTVIRRTAILSVVRVSLMPKHTVGRDVIVTASRHDQPRSEAPVIVTVSDSDVFRASQAISLAEGLAFQPGLRLENDCQNCGFTQVRLNGLQGPYTQILIDSRPIFSSLNGVYGLEQIPVAMIDRIEVVRGGASAVYGSGAIAGTINVIPKDPRTTSASVSSTTSWLGGRIPDVSLAARGTWSSQDLRYGLTVFGTARNRYAYDRNNDGFSELPILQSSAGGLRFTTMPEDEEKITAEAHWIREFRRGGNLFTLPPHSADIAEQLDHSIAGGAVSYERYLSSNVRASAYGSGQVTHRESYYGGTGGDTSSAALAAAATYYGTTHDIIGVVGLQLTATMSNVLDNQFVLVTGVEGWRDHVADVMAGYSRNIDQTSQNVATYAQFQFAPGSPLSVAAGARLDVASIRGDYQFDASASERRDNTYVVVNPRMSVIGKMSEESQLRATYGSGFRAPQAFDEDLHVSTLQGTARLIRIDPGLRPERSHSVSLSIDHTTATPRTAFGYTVDAFATLLQAPFVTALTADSAAGSPANIALKTNGDAAWVAGVNGEVRMAVANGWECTAAITIQDARYVTAQVLAQDDAGAVVSSPYIPRTPNVYGSLTANITPTEGVTLDVATVITGPMWAVNERTILLNRTPWFADVSVRAMADIHVASDLELAVSVGVVNLFDMYQRDLEVGVLRDAAYIYGPVRPRTLSVGVQLQWQ